MFLRPTLLLLALVIHRRSLVIDRRNVSVRDERREGPLATLGCCCGGSRSKLRNLGDLGVVRVESVGGLFAVQFARNFLEHVLVRLNPGGGLGRRGGNERGHSLGTWGGGWVRSRCPPRAVGVRLPMWWGAASPGGTYLEEGFRKRKLLRLFKMVETAYRCCQ